MSIFHCLDFDSKTYTVYLVDDNPETNLNTEYYNRFVDPFNCKFECIVAEHSTEKNF